MKILEISPGQNHWKVRVALRHKEYNDISKWCREHECGKQVSINQFAFRNESELTMFRLKWETE